MADKKAGKRKNAPGQGRKKGVPGNRGRGGKKPEDLMNAMVTVGPRIDHDEPPIEPEVMNADFAAERVYIDPVEFCLAVINGDVGILTRCGVTSIPDMDQKLEASRIAVKYTNQAKPVETITKHEHSWMDTISGAERRVKNLRMDIPEHDDVGAPETVN